MTQMVRELKNRVKVNYGMRKFLPALVLFLILFESMRAFALSSGWPVAYGSIKSVIGWRKDPFGSGKMKWHNGIDIAVAPNTPVTPAGPGLIRYSGWNRDYGWLVVVDHHNGWFSMYGHNSALAVKVGQEVTPETVISYAGSTGRSTGVHIHFERRWYPEGTMQAPAAADVNAIGEYPDREIEAPQGRAEQKAEGIRQSALDFEQPQEEPGEPGLNGYGFSTPGGTGGE
jgi:murein DD-endopeptidase MepM/ murein hydrolase activator NlpD